MDNSFMVGQLVFDVLMIISLGFQYKWNKYQQEINELQLKANQSIIRNFERIQKERK